MKRHAFTLALMLLATSQLYSFSSQQQRRQVIWYERALRHVNPDERDFGSIWEQRKQEFVDQLRNPYFRYGLGTTLTIVALFVTLLALYTRHRRALEFAAQSIADIRQHDEYARRAAREAIRRYNDHIEFCNRVIEGDESGLWKWMSGAELNAMKCKMQQLNNELATAQREVKRLKEELEIKTAAIADMSMRSQNGARQVTQPPKPSAPAPAPHVERINQLELELVDERKKNLRFKGGTLDVNNS